MATVGGCSGQAATSARVPNSGLIVVTASDAIKDDGRPRLRRGGRIRPTPRSGTGPESKRGDEHPHRRLQREPGSRAVLHVHTIATTLLASSNAAEGSVGPQVLHFSGSMLKGWGMWEEEAEANSRLHQPLTRATDCVRIRRLAARSSAGRCSESTSVLIANHGVTSGDEHC